jgi:hypothetical protein
MINTALKYKNADLEVARAIREQELHQGNLASNCIKTPKTARNLLS